MPESPAVRSRTRGLVAAVVAASALAGALAGPTEAHASPGRQVTSTARPIPPAIARAVARAVAARSARPAPFARAPFAPAPLPRAPFSSAGIRLVPGTTVSTDLPTRIAVGTSITVVRFTVASPNDYRAPIGVVTLLDNDHLLTQVGVYGTAPGQTTYRGALGMDERTLSTRGTATWILGVFDEADPTGEAGQIAFLDTTVKLRSLLAQSMTRTGDIINLAGATKAYVADEHYAAYPSHRLYLQRWTKTGWATIRDLQTDRLGHVGAQIRIPFRTGLRLWSPDSPTTFGAVTAPTVL